MREEPSDSDALASAFVTVLGEPDPAGRDRIPTRSGDLMCVNLRGDIPRLMMPQEITEQLKDLSEQWCTTEFIQELLGIDLPTDPRLAGAFRAWSARFLGKANVVSGAGAGLRVDRHALETFILQNGWVSWKSAAVHLALSEGNLKTVVERLQGNERYGLIPQLASGVSDQVVRQREAAALYRLFPAIRMKVFASHSGMCRALHAEIKNELGVEVEPLLCVTSVALADDEPDLADAFDAITLEPVGLRYQVWLDTKKPVNLRPDVCSLKFYAMHEAQLKPYVMEGSEPSAIDPKLRDAA